MTTQNIIGYELSAQGTTTVQSANPNSLQQLEGNFTAATPTEMEQALQKAESAWREYRNYSGKQKATFLRAIAEEIEALDESLVKRAMSESGLPEGRIKGERGRTTGQLKLFADLVEEGSWLEATIDTKTAVDLRKTLVALGPVVVFTASNFPLAFSTAGGDTASALASGCPVIVKAHEAHLGTNALVAQAIQRAAQKTGMPDGVFSSLNGNGYQLGSDLVKHPLTKAVAFTGSLQGGKALYDLAQQREMPIPVFAEMGSVNPIFILPKKLETEQTTLANEIAGSINLGAGQFCTNPGLLVCIENETTGGFINDLKNAFEGLQPQTMLHQGIFNNYEKNKRAILGENGVETLVQQENDKTIAAKPAVATVSAKEFLANPKLHEEVFGPFSLLICCSDAVEMEKVGQALAGQLTATIMGDEVEATDFSNLIHVLQEKVGRLIFNGVPTGVAVCHAMQHGGPYPASTDSRFTSVGTSAIKRFARPITFQNTPQSFLPAALKDGNPLNIWRTVDGEFMK